MNKEWRYWPTIGSTVNLTCDESTVLQELSDYQFFKKNPAGWSYNSLQLISLLATLTNKMTEQTTHLSLSTGHIGAHIDKLVS